MLSRGVHFLLAFLFSVFTYAQQAQVDSLLLLSSQLNGLHKAKILVELSNATVYSETPKALVFAEDAFRIASNIGNDSIKYAALKAMGYANGYLGNFDVSIKNMQDGLAYYETNKDSSKIAEALSDIAYLLSATSSSEENIMEYNQRALSIREKIGDEKGVAYSLNNIGALYWKWQKFDQAIDYFLEALPFMERLKLNEEIATTTGNIGSYYIENKEYDKAHFFLNRALEKYRLLDHHLGEAKMLAALGRLAYLENNIDEAIALNEQSKNIRQKLGDREGLIGNYYNIGYYQLQQNELNDAEFNLMRSRDIAEEIRSVDRLIQVYQTLSDLSVKQGRYKNAYRYLQKSKRLNDSIFSLEQHRQLEEIRTRFDVERKEAENMALQMENENQQLILRKNRSILYLSSGFAFVLLLFLIVFYQKRRTAYQMNALITEQKLLRSQMNPHFIFNSIAAIQNYIFNHSPKDAVNYLSSFAGLMRQILENSRKEYIDFEDELKWLDNYFALQKLRYSNRFDYKIEIDEALNEQALLIPPMIVQPFIENAIEHGIKEMPEAGMIWLRYKKSGSFILIEIEDNGIGILKSKKQKLADHQSFAIDATKNRLRVLHKKEKTSMQFDVIDKSEQELEQNGTIVRFSLPYHTKF